MLALTSFNWGAMFISFVVICTVVGIATPLICAKSVLGIDFATFFCVVSLVMGLVFSIQIGIIANKQPTKTIKSTATIETQQSDTNIEYQAYSVDNFLKN